MSESKKFKESKDFNKTKEHKKSKISNQSIQLQIQTECPICFQTENLLKSECEHETHRYCKKCRAKIRSCSLCRKSLPVYENDEPMKYNISIVNNFINGIINSLKGILKALAILFCVVIGFFLVIIGILIYIVLWIPTLLILFLLYIPAKIFSFDVNVKLPELGTIIMKFGVDLCQIYD